MVRDLQFEIRLEPGEATFLNNYTIMHARSEFEDWGDPGKNRLMLRLWLDVERNARPVVPNIHTYENDAVAVGLIRGLGGSRPWRPTARRTNSCASLRRLNNQGENGTLAVRCRITREHTRPMVNEPARSAAWQTGSARSCCAGQVPGIPPLL
jgi:hypothetical protein